MAERTLQYVINNPLELNLSYMPFITNGGIFIPTSEKFELGDLVTVDLLLAIKNANVRISGKIVWITPGSALHHVLPGIGVQFVGATAAVVRSEIETSLAPSMEVGGYTYGITDGAMKGQ
jgi:type IV pilus assembly protein PilZ